MEAHGIPENFSDPGFRVDWLRVILKILSQKSSGLDGHIYFYHLLPNMIQVTSVDSLYIYIYIYVYIYIYIHIHNSFGLEQKPHIFIHICQHRTQQVSDGWSFGKGP